MRPNPWQRITVSEIAVAAAALLLAPAAIGGMLYASLAPFDDAAAVHHGGRTAPADPAGPAVVAAADPGAGSRADPAPAELRAAAAAAAPAAPPPAPPKRTVRRRAQRPPPPAPPQQEDFPQRMKSWFTDVARDVGVLPRDAGTADAGR